jgi:CO/xanthine dehydrogenase FAD-binding subunit
VPEIVTAWTKGELRELVSTGDLLAGGTDLLVQLQKGRKPARLVDVSKLLDGPAPIRAMGPQLEVSALISLGRLSKELDGVLPSLEMSVALFGSVRIRNRATIGGNLGNASPAGDTIPPLVAADAVAVLEGAAGSRRVPVAELVTGPGKTVVGNDEWIDMVVVPVASGEEGFRKFGTRKADAISIVSLAWRWRRDEDGTLHDVALAFGAVAPTVVRARRAEAELEGRRPDEKVIEQVVVALESDISPIDDIRASARFRREMSGVLLREELGSRQRPLSGRTMVRTTPRRSA